MQITEAQRKAYTKLKSEGKLQGCDTLTRSELNGELYFKRSDGGEIIAIHESGIVTIHKHNKV